MLISVHMPKTAGTSFTESLRGHFGARLTLAYGDRPLHRPAWQRNGNALGRALRNAVAGPGQDSVDCIHGHFLPLAFRWVGASASLRFVTWLRDPTDRLVSHYEHWRREAAPATDTLHQRMLDENWSFEAFAFRPELRNVYSLFLWGFPVDRFNFIGITEHYDADLEVFGRHLLGAHLSPARVRQNPKRSTDTYELDEDLRRRIEHVHEREFALYRHALALREQRAGEGLDAIRR